MKCRVTEFEAGCKRCRFYLPPGETKKNWVGEMGECMAKVDKKNENNNVFVIWRDECKKEECPDLDPVRDVPRKSWWRRLFS